MNFLIYQMVAGVPPGPHFKHCLIYEGYHCSCDGHYQGPEPGPTIHGTGDISISSKASSTSSDQFDKIMKGLS